MLYGVVCSPAQCPEDAWRFFGFVPSFRLSPVPIDDGSAPAPAHVHQTSIRIRTDKQKGHKVVTVRNSQAKGQRLLKKKQRQMDELKSLCV
jgi:hypothetical protein